MNLRCSHRSIIIDYKYTPMTPLKKLPDEGFPHIFQRETRLVAFYSRVTNEVQDNDIKFPQQVGTPIQIRPT